MILCIEEPQNMNNFIPVVTLFGIIVTFAMSFFNYLFNKRKDLEEQLFEVKIKAYKDLSNTAFRLIEYLKIQGYPFPDSDNSYHMEEMKDFFKKESDIMSNKIVECKEVGQNYMVLLPAGSINHYYPLAEISETVSVPPSK